MSIEIDNPQTVQEKLDAIANLIEQMHLAHAMNDNQRFAMAHEKAAQLAFDLLNTLLSDE